jgi:GWxTD domain-containing protein
MKNIPVVIILILMWGVAWGQADDFNSGKFYVDFASFKSDTPGLNQFEVYYQVFTSGLLYIHQKDEYMAHYSIGVIIKKSGKQVTASEKEEFIRELSYDKTTGEKDFVINSFKFKLPPGKYELNISLHDLNSDDVIPLKAPFTIPDYEKELSTFSQILYARKVELLPADSATGDTLRDKTVRNFAKRDWLVIPSCSRNYGDEATQLKFYYEFYSLKPMADSNVVVYEIIDKRDNTVAADTVALFLNMKTSMIGTLSLEHMRPGQYELRITAYDSAHKKLAVSKSSFSVVWSALALVQNDFETAIEQLRYAANNEQLNKIKKAPEKDRIKAWNEFWKSKDPTPNTEENEVKDEYYRRIAYANKHFSFMNKEGWRSDFGMIYIIYGEPDEIERHPYDRESRPYEIWYYYNPRRTFLFVDSGGYGEYILQYPYDGDVNKNRY